MTQVSVKKLNQVNVCGFDYPMPYGTGVRDYIHVSDLADGHVKALGKLEENLELELVRRAKEAFLRYVSISDGGK